MEGISISLFKLEALMRDHRIRDELKITDLRYLVKRFMFTSISSLVPIIGRAEKVLDVGCGSAPYCSLFSNVSCYIGIDLNPQKRPNIVASTELLPIRSRSFNVVISTQVLMHLNEPLNFLKEASRVLDRGGFLLISAHGIWYERHEPGFKDLYSSEAIYQKIGTQGQDLKINGTIALKMYLSDIYSWASSFDASGVFERSPPLLSYDELASLPQVALWSIVLAPIFITLVFITYRGKGQN